MSNKRVISPFISVLLSILMLAGTSGFTFVRHNCYHCGVSEVLTPVELNASGDNCCCSHNTHKHSNNKSGEGTVIDNDCCSHELQRVVTDETVRPEVQPEIYPYFQTSSVNAFTPEQIQSGKVLFFPFDIITGGRKLTLLHCQLIS